MVAEPYEYLMLTAATKAPFFQPYSPKMDFKARFFRWDVSLAHEKLEVVNVARRADYNFSVRRVAG
jgi:hypothetical protein